MPGEGGDRVKLAVLSLLHDEYGITEEDFLSAELAAVRRSRRATSALTAA